MYPEYLRFYSWVKNYVLHNTAYIEGNEPVRLGRDVIYATSEKRNTQKKGEVRLSTFVPTGARKASHDKVTLRTNNAITNIIFKPLLQIWHTQKKRVVQMVLLYLVIAYIVYWLYFILKDRFWSAIQVRPRPSEWNTEVSFRRLTPFQIPCFTHAHTHTHIVVCSS